MTAYLPYGAERGDTTDDLAIDRGWLGQYEDSGTGLTYLHARYYDPALGRFLSPDPLMNPGDPRTLDPYMYAANNLVSFMDATGLCYGVSHDKMAACAQSLNTSAAALAKAKTKAQGVVGVTGMLAGGLLKGVGKGVLGLTPFPGMIDGFHKTGDVIRDPRGTWNGQWNGLGTQWSNTWHDVKRTGEAFSDAVGGRNTWNNYWHVGTHTWMAGHIGENYDNGTWFNIAEGAGDARVNAGVIALTAGVGAAASGARAASTLERTGVFVGHPVPIGPVPESAWVTLARVDTKGSPFPGFKGGSIFRNENGQLPSTPGVTYREWDVNPVKGATRDGYRIVTGSDGSAFWTGNHYGDFVTMRGPAA
jgi:RHS repeat-associated protein